MSAWMVPKSHIDYLVTAALVLPRRNLQGHTLRWWVRPIPTEDGATHQRGEPWGPEAANVVQSLTRTMREEDASQVGAMLWAENRRSIDYRYAEEELEDPYIFERVDADEIKAGRVLHAIACFEYQACEHPEWLDSEAHHFCQALQAEAIHALPEFANGWPVEDVKYQQGISILDLMPKRGDE